MKILVHNTSYVSETNMNKVWIIILKRTVQLYKFYIRKLFE